MTLEIHVSEVIHVLDVFVSAPVRRVIRAATFFARNSSHKIAQFLASHHLISRGPPDLDSMVKTLRGSRSMRVPLFCS